MAGEAPQPGPQTSPESPKEALKRQLKLKSRAELAELAGQVENSDLVSAVRAKALEDLKNKILEKGFDFEGSYNEAPTLEQNPVYKHLMEKFRTLLESGDASIPIRMQVNWMNHVIDALAEGVSSYSGAFRKMSTEEVNTTFAGIEPLKDWFEKNYKKEYASWSARKKQTAEQTATVAEGKTVAKTAFESSLAALGPVAQFEGVKKTADQLKADLAKADTQEKLDQLKTPMEGFPFGAQVKTAFENLTTLKQDIASLPNNEATAEFVRKSNLLENNLKAAADETALNQCKTDLETLNREVQAVKEAASSAPAEEGEKPWADKLMDFAEHAEEGKFKSLATRLVSLMVLIAATLSKWGFESWAGDICSDERLEKMGDAETKEKAKLRIATKREFKNFGLPVSLAKQVGGKKTKDAIKALVELAGTSQDAAEKEKLNQLVSQLKKKNGESSDKTLYEFMGNPGWQFGVQHQTGAPETPPTPAAPATPAAAPAAAPPPRQP